MCVGMCVGMCWLVSGWDCCSGGICRFQCLMLSLSLCVFLVLVSRNLPRFVRPHDSDFWQPIRPVQTVLPRETNAARVYRGLHGRFQIHFEWQWRRQRSNLEKRRQVQFGRSERLVATAVQNMEAHSTFFTMFCCIFLFFYWFLFFTLCNTVRCWDEPNHGSTGNRTTWINWRSGTGTRKKSRALLGTNTCQNWLKKCKVRNERSAAGTTANANERRNTRKRGKWSGKKKERKSSWRRKNSVHLSV